MASAGQPDVNQRSIANNPWFASITYNLYFTRYIGERSFQPILKMVKCFVSNIIYVLTIMFDTYQY